MTQQDKLAKYCEDRLLNAIVEEGLLQIGGDIYIIVENEKIFDDEMMFVPFTRDEVDGFVYEFIGRWYTQDIEEQEVQFIPFEWIGEAVQEYPTPYFLGIHSGYELLSGVGNYPEWIKKAKFLGCEALGICEHHTLAGVIAFQSECKKAGIKSIIGMSVDVVSSLGKYRVKCYAQDYEGWQALLHFNAILNVDGEKRIEQRELYDKYERGGLVVIVDPKHSDFNVVPDWLPMYQLDTVEWKNEHKDSEYIDNLEQFVLRAVPVAIVDAYYIEQDDSDIRELLTGIGKTYAQKSGNQYFKSNDQYFRELVDMFSRGPHDLYTRAQMHLKNIVDSCDFTYDTSNRHLPRYRMTEEEAKQFPTNKDLFLHLVTEGFKKRGIAYEEPYISRIKEEIRVLNKGDVIDYFLVLHDIIQYANKEDILVGIGRGSAGGSLVSYLLGIIQINPIEFNLIFERFLNDGRMGYMGECKAYKINDEVTLNEGSLLKIKRGEVEKLIFVEDLEEGDELIQY